MIKLWARLRSALTCDYPKRLSYIWQGSDYGVRRFLSWWGRLSNYRDFTKRGDLVPTIGGKIVRLSITLLALAYLLLNALTILLLIDSFYLSALWLIMAVLLYPYVVAIATIVPVFILRELIHRPKQRSLVRRAHRVFHTHQATVIAVSGSYGKTTMKELLKTVLGEHLKVAYTPGNRNVISSQAQFALSLDGDEDVLIVEFGEASPRDVAKMTELCEPDFAIITGIAPNHLDGYGSVEGIASDFSYLLDWVGSDSCYINTDNQLSKQFFEGKGHSFSVNGARGLRVSEVQVLVNKLMFKLNSTKRSFDIKSNLIGRHNIAPLALAVHLAVKLGVPASKIERALVTLEPYEHRMQPRRMNDAWLIDDTYNGSIEGMRAGLSYLKEIDVPGKKIYVTPGLVDQGNQTVAVHSELGELIAKAKPDSVYLMRNSTTEITQRSLETAGYKGKVNVVDEPLSFYLNISDVLANGDVILCQNDWTDYYA